jgi:hypothetical protein
MRRGEPRIYVGDKPYRVLERLGYQSGIGLDVIVVADDLGVEHFAVGPTGGPWRFWTEAERLSAKWPPAKLLV